MAVINMHPDERFSNIGAGFGGGFAQMLQVLLQKKMQEKQDADAIGKVTALLTPGAQGAPDQGGGPQPDGVTPDATPQAQTAAGAQKAMSDSLQQTDDGGMGDLTPDPLQSVVPSKAPDGSPAGPVTPPSPGPSQKDFHEVDLVKLMAAAGGNPAAQKVAMAWLDGQKLRHGQMMEELAQKRIDMSERESLRKDARADRRADQADDREERLARGQERTAERLEKSAAAQQEIAQKRLNLETLREQHSRELDPLKKQHLEAQIKKENMQIQQMHQNEEMGQKLDKAPTGANAVAGVSEEDAAQVKAIAEGRMAPYTGYALSRPRGQYIMGLVNKYDPTYDANNFTQRRDTQKAFAAGGKMSQRLLAGNNVITHLHSLSKAYEAIDSGDQRLANQAFNAIKRAVVGNPEMAAFTTTSQVLSSEMRKFFAGASGGGLTELKDWEKVFEGKATPGEAKATIKQALELMGAQYETIANQWNQSMGQDLAPDHPKFMNPDNATRWHELGGSSIGGSPVEGGAPKPSAEATAEAERTGKAVVKRMDKPAGEPSAGVSIPDLRKKMASAKESGEAIEVAGKKIKWLKDENRWADAE